MKLQQCGILLKVDPNENAHVFSPLIKTVVWTQIDQIGPRLAGVPAATVMALALQDQTNNHRYVFDDTENEAKLKRI